MIRAATLCSGIGAPETALPEWEWAWCSEIEPHPCRILAHRFPHTVNLGDMTADDFSARARSLGPIDVLIAGTPCQDFSIAGLRAGLRGARGNLTLRALQIYEDTCDAARSAGRREPLFWWENVPGVLSDRSNAFGNFLGGLAGSATALVPPDGCGWTDAGVVAGPRRIVAWRVLDAQYFGLAQRRKRVFVVASSIDGPDPAEILLEPAGVSRNPPARQSAKETVAALTAPGVGTCGPDDNQGQAGHLSAYGGNNCSGPIDVTTALNAHGGPAGRLDFETETFVCATLDASFGRLQGCSGQDANHGHSHLVAHALTGEGFDASEGGTGRGTPIAPIAFDCKAGGDTSFSISAVPGTLRGDGHGGGHAAAVTQHGVRRLMPLECERLQGFPDGHTDVPNGNKPAADGPRYKAIGNSMARPVIRWIGLRMQRALDRAAVIAA